MRTRLLGAGALAVFVVAALLTQGYGVGYRDHAIHLVFLERAIDPAFLRGDLIAEQASHHFSWFWALQAPLVRLFGLEATYLGLHIASLALMLVGVVHLTRALAPASLAQAAGWWACVPAALGVATFGDIPSFDAQVLNRTVAIGPELMALALAVRRRGVAALLLLGVVANVHVTTAAHAAILATCVMWIDRAERRWLPLGISGFVAGALPVLVMAASAHVAGGGSDALWRSAVERHWPFHHFVAWMPPAAWCALIISAASVVAGLAGERPPALLVMAGAVAVVFVGNVFLTELTSSHVGIELHLFECGRLLAYLGFAATATACVRALRRPPSLAWAAFGSYLTLVAYAMLYDRYDARIERVLMIAAIVFAAAALARRTAHGLPEVRAIPRWALPILIVLVVPITSLLRGSRSALAYHLTDLRARHAVCEKEMPPTPLASRAQVCGGPLMTWAKEHLPADARVVLPPYFDHPLAAFRAIARRSVLVTHKDGGEATFDPVFAAEWLSRMEAVAGPFPPLALPRLAALHSLLSTQAPSPYDPWWDAVTRALRRYEGSNATRFLSLRARYGVTHAVCPRRAACAELAFPVVYEDAAFRMFELR